MVSLQDNLLIVDPEQGSWSEYPGGSSLSSISRPLNFFRTFKNAQGMEVEPYSSELKVSSVPVWRFLSTSKAPIFRSVFVFFRTVFDWNVCIDTHQVYCSTCLSKG